MHRVTDPLAGVQPDRIVTPRKRGYFHMRLAAVHTGETINLDTGEIDVGTYCLTEDRQTVFDLPALVHEAPPTVFITTDPSVFLSTLDDAFLGDPEWRRTLHRIPKEIGSIELARVKVSMFGFARTGSRQQRRHQLWNPRDVSPSVWHKILDTVTHETLLEWATDVRSWAQENDLELRNAFAGYAGQLLRDSRFYPNARRKVPGHTNEKARPALPGNLVSLYVTPGPTAYDVINIDQKRAHHRIVQELPLPDANTLYARGWFHDLERTDYWTEPGKTQFDRSLYEPGLLYVGMHSHPTSNISPFRLPIQNYAGFKRVFIWTNTIEFLRTHGSYIEGIYAAWTAVGKDTGLPRYGEWSETQIETASPQRKKWLKPLLHSTYGLLAARPRTLEVGHYNSEGGKPAQFVLGARTFDVQMTTLKSWQPKTANVIQRGMIEAETQLRSLIMAEHLTDAGCNILHIHTDGMHVQGQLPILPNTWDVTELTRVMYLDNASWIAEERECLPGRDQQARKAEITHYGKLHTALTETRTSR